MTLDTASIRRQFPALAPRAEKQLLTYLDSAATTQIPEAVLNAMNEAERGGRGNPHRGMHVLAEKATLELETARSTVAQFIGAESSEILFTGNCTAALNTVAKSWGKANLQKGDMVLLTILEHHSAAVPWLQLKQEIGIEVTWIGMDETGMPRMEELDSYLRTGRVKMVCVTGLSNVLGVRPPLKEIIERAHAAEALVTVDAAQLIAHHPVSVSELDCDFLAFSGHKLYGPTGIGVLFGKHELLKTMPPFLGGGGMIDTVTTDDFTTTNIPQKFEAGTPPLTQAIGLGAAIKWLMQYSWQDIETHEDLLMRSAEAALTTIDGLTILPSQSSKPIAYSSPRSACLSFTLDGIHPHDLTDILGTRGICLRAGHHCTQPLHDALGIPASTRLSVGIYTTEEEILLLPAAIEKALKILR